MQARMNNIAIIVPDAMQALLAFGASTERGCAFDDAWSGPAAREPDQWLQRLRCHAPSPPQEGRRSRRPSLGGGGVAGCALLHRCRERRAGAHRDRYATQ